MYRAMTISRAQLRPSNERSGNLCIGIVVCFFCITILVGTAFFVLYLVLPVTATTSWFPIAGIFLISLPWIFWTLTCAYRLVTRSMGPAGQPTHGADTVAPAGGGATAADIKDEGDAKSPGGARRVRFGGATEMAAPDSGTSGAGTDCRHGAATSRDEGSSPRSSNESELPLALSMS